MNKIHEWVNTGLILVVAILVLVGGNQSAVGASGTRFPNGLSTNTTSPSAGEIETTTLTVTATSTSASQGTPSYFTLGGVDYADVEVSLSATSSVPGIIPNPFGTATSTLVLCQSQVTVNGIAATQNLYVSTTTGTGGYGSSTPAIMTAFVTGTGQFTAPCGFNSATSTANVATAQPNATQSDLLPGRTQTGASNYIVGPSEFLTLRIATATPRTLDTYWTGTFFARFMKP